jgi:mannitol/fructose-specific phosphotransferase system IIA component (Ntr-type)
MALRSLADYTRPELIVPELRERDAAGIVAELSRVLGQANRVPDFLQFYQAALNQESLSNSSLPCGIALPHARLNGLAELHFAVGRAPQPVNWGAKSSWPVRLVFLIAVPATDAASYLQLLSSLARLGHSNGTLAKLFAAPDAWEMLRILRQMEALQK